MEFQLILYLSVHCGLVEDSFSRPPHNYGHQWMKLLWRPPTMRSQPQAVGGYPIGDLNTHILATRDFLCVLDKWFKFGAKRTTPVVAFVGWRNGIGDSSRLLLVMSSSHLPHWLVNYFLLFLLLFMSVSVMNSKVWMLFIGSSYFITFVCNFGVHVSGNILL